MSIPSWPSKDPDETLDYAIDWSDRLPIEDLIAQSIWTVPAGLTETRSEFAGQQSVVWLSGGSESQSCSLTNTITTAQGRVLQQTVRIRIKSR
jgi:hypothetical protein